jgi:hypothetical protein
MPLDGVGAVRSGPPSYPYSPKCVEGLFCEVRRFACYIGRGPK